MTNIDSKRENILSKVQKILDRAEGTDHQGEIDAALAMAQKLMLEYAIEQSEVDKIREQDRQPEQIIQREIFVSSTPRSPQANDKGRMAMVVTKNNRCHVYRLSAMPGYWLMFTGYESDVEYAEMLWTSLCLQMERAHNIAKENKRDWVNARTFRSNFNAGFISEAGRRLELVQQKAENELEQEHGKAAGSTAIVLRNREDDVNQWMKENGPRLKRRYKSRRNYDGHAKQQGTTAATKADYSGGSRKGLNSRKLLN